MKIILLSFIILLFGTTLSAAQTPAPTPSKQSTQESRREMERQRAVIERQNRDFERLKNSEKSVFVKRESVPFKMPVTREQRRRLKPDERLALKYKAFLDQSGTGLIKLFPDKGCEENSYVLRADADCRNWVPNGAFYSFREDEHTSDFLADISYKKGALITNGILSQGILTHLGDIPLENVSLSTNGIRYLVEYQPAQQSKEANKQFNEISRGVKNGAYIYRKVVPADENTTYAVRVIAYKGKYMARFRGRLYDILYGDNRLDLLVAFRIVDINKDDGSVTLLWKKLDQRNAPRIVFPKKNSKKNESADFKE